MSVAVQTKKKDDYAAAVRSVGNQVLNRPASGASMSSATSSALTQPVQSRTNQTLGQIQQAVESPAFQFTGPEPFQYDYRSDPGYQAALRSAQETIRQNQADTGAFLRARGQGKSSYSETVANQIGAREMGRVTSEVLPALIEQAYARYADQANRNLETQRLNYGVGQDRIANLANLYSLQNQQDFANPLAEAQVTGRYLSGDARNYVDAILDLKRQAESPGTTPEQLASYRQQADAYRSALRSLGYDPSLLGADVNAETAAGNVGQLGIPTLAASIADRNAALADRSQGLQELQVMAGLTGMLPDGTPTVAEKQRLFENDLVQQQFDEDKRRFGLEYALSKQVQLGNLDLARARQALSEEMQRANLALAQDDNARQWAQLDWQMSQPASTPSGGLSASQVLDGVRRLYSEPVLDPTSDEVINRITTDPLKREQMFLSVVDAGLPDNETRQVLLMLGMPTEEINRLTAKYSGPAYGPPAPAR